MQEQPQKPPAAKVATAMPPRQPQTSAAPVHLKELIWPDSPPMDESPGSSLPSRAPVKPSSADGGDSTAAETYLTPLQSPFPITSSADSTAPANIPATAANSSLVVSLGRIVSAKPPSSALVVAGDGETGGAFGFRKWKKKKKKEEEGVVGEIVNRSRKKAMLMRAALGLRVYEFVLSLISFAVMASNTTQGWSGDSFSRHKEYRYCLSVNVIAFAYAVFQAFNLTYNMVSGKQFIKHHLHHQFNFLMDQILAYLLISASSAAASRVDDWQSNWGKDEFTEKASISASISFLSFIGFGLSSLISGHNLCNRDFT